MIFEYRALILAVIEIAIMLFVLSRGVSFKKLIASIIFFLAMYQIGEAILLLTDYDMTGLKIAYFATTLLPGLGLILVEKLSKEERFGKYVLTFGAVLSVLFVLLPEPVYFHEKISCILKITSAGNTGFFYNTWAVYYLGTLALSIIYIIWLIWKANTANERYNLWLMLLAYLAFFPSSIILVYILKLDFAFTASVMCSLAVITTFIVGFISVRKMK
ncbi:hypothetical protein KC678_02505 [Candidatus Dojkabacteria bacterium]|uniref:Histidine kinase N-terminal 7TM region domain-containing protein n=1 Tax=Candidatus Dojkabacteria bacterium TaxID=2099670 RepID=A0A955IB56_9BACT|nr:hypothetical protein [Candidatus Dojkabacteria bacterium]